MIIATEQDPALRLLAAELSGTGQTARAWLAGLLKDAWQAEASAAGRSDDIYRVMVATGIVPGEVSEGGEVSCDWDAADEIVLAAIGAMGTAGA